MKPLLDHLLQVAHVAFGIFAELLAPSRCAACDAPVLPRALFCPACAATVNRFTQRPLADERSEPPRTSRDRSNVYAAFEYGGAMATAVTRLKYLDRADLAPRLALAMIPAAREIGRVDRVVPIPLHPRRMAERGYNHAALLAGPVARALSVGVSPRAVARVRDTPRQATLDRAARLVNVRDSFIARSDLVLGARILLVDDVRTTGATLESCARTLREAGARDVVSLVLAQRP